MRFPKGEENGRAFCIKQKKAYLCKDNNHETNVFKSIDMKKYLYLLPIALMAFAACNGDEPNEGGKTEAKTFAVEPTSVSVAADATTASISVKGNVAWTAVSSNSAVAVSPASGNGAGTISLSFAANEAETAVTATITVATTEAVSTKSFAVSFTQAAAEKVDPTPTPAPADTTFLARWRFAKGSDEDAALTAHFMEDAKITVDGTKITNPESMKPGNGGYYVEPNVAGKGRIEYYNGIDKSDINPGGRCKRVVGAAALCQFGPWKEDYWLITAETDEAVAAGTTLHFFAALRSNTAITPKHWLAEIKDGDKWVPAMETKKVIVGEVEVEYNMELTFDHTGGADAGKPNATTALCDVNYTLTSATKDPQLRITCVTTLYAEDGMGPAEHIGDFAGSTVLTKAANPVVMLVGERDNGGCAPINKNTMICILPAAN